MKKKKVYSMTIRVTFCMSNVGQLNNMYNIYKWQKMRMLKWMSGNTLKDETQNECMKLEIAPASY